MSIRHVDDLKSPWCHSDRNSMRCQPVSLTLNRFISESGTSNRDSFRNRKNWSRKTNLLQHARVVRWHYVCVGCVYRRAETHHDHTGYTDMDWKNWCPVKS